MRNHILLLSVVLFVIFPGHCFGASAAAPGTAIPQFEHVFVVVEENQSYNDVVGNTQDLPYLNSLIRGYGLATNYYPNTHPSVNDNFILTAGHPGFASFWTSNGLLADLHSRQVSGVNIASVLTDNNKSWKAYLEDLPEARSVTSSHGVYVRRHDPFSHFTTVVHRTRDHPPQTANLILVAGNFEKDLRNRSFPSYSFVVPDIYDDGHDDAKTHKEAACGNHVALQQIDQWLNRNIRPLVEGADFNRSALLIILFDEACGRGPLADNRLNPMHPSLRGGGHIPALVIRSKTKPGTTSDQFLHHESILPLCLRVPGIQQFPGAAATAPDLSELFTQPRAEIGDRRMPSETQGFHHVE